MEPAYGSLVAALRSFIFVMGWDIRITGDEHIPASGGAVIATNHVGYLDWLFVGLAARRRGRNTRFLAKQELWGHRISGPVMRGARHIPVDRYGSPQHSVERAVEALRRGEIVGMFPEATISRSFVPAPGKSGSARMAMAAGVPLIPGAVWGSQRLLTKGRPRNLQRGIVITADFGEPVPYEPDESPAEVTRRLMDRITDLADRAARCYPDQPSGPGDDWWVPAHLGGSAPTVEEALAMAREDADRKRAARSED